MDLGQWVETEQGVGGGVPLAEAAAWLGLCSETGEEVWGAAKRRAGRESVARTGQSPCSSLHVIWQTGELLKASELGNVRN